jgi:phosphatidate cytidylyltransferase
MKGRIFSTLLLWGILIVTAVFLKSVGAVLLATAAAFMMQIEFYEMMKKKGHNPLVYAGLAFGLLISLSPLASDVTVLHGTSLVLLAMVVLSAAALVRKPRGSLIDALGSTFIGLLLGPCALSCVSQTVFHFGPEGKGLLMALWIVMTAKFTDMGALLTGVAIGKHKLAPTLSPKKTWEGVFGGTALCLISSALYAHFLSGYLPIGFTPLVATMMALPIAAAAIMADLIESAFKRECGVKDSGNLLPGIGGVFDLTDSFMLTAPLGYYMAVLILG